MRNARIFPLAGPPVHPALVRVAEERARNLQNRIADLITRFAGSMPFVYVHVLWFSIWIASGVEKFPFGFLTMLVSLEAIFLSTFVMISQNRADERRQAIADHQWELVQLEKVQNDELIELARRTYQLSSEMHEMTAQLHQLLSRQDS